MARSVTVDVPNRRIAIVLGPIGPEVTAAPTLPASVTAVPASMFLDAAQSATVDIVTQSGTYSNTYSNTY